jgi:undecaprenyl-diphosphatase
MLDIIKAIIYGIVQGVTEWLPISSTGHLLLIENFIPFKEVTEGFFGMFDVVIQLGSIMAVVVLFWEKIWPFTLRGKERKGAGTVPSFIKMDIIILWIKIMVSCIPAVIVALLFDDILEELFYRYEVIGAALVLFGIAFIIIESRNKGKDYKITELSKISYQAAVWIGMFQVIAAVFPGTSRSGATIIGALMIGVSRKAAAEYTFFLAIPVMFGASLLKLMGFGLNLTSIELLLLAIGTIVAFVVSLFILRFLIGYVKKHDFKIFGWYRIVLGIIVLLYFGVVA